MTASFPRTPRTNNGLSRAGSLDILSVLLSKTKQTLAKDATLTAFEDVIMDVFKVHAGRRRRCSGAGARLRRGCVCLVLPA